MNLHRHLMALAMNSDIATLHLSETAIPVKITEVESANDGFSSSMTTFKCLVVNDDQIKVYGERAKRELNSVYGVPRRSGRYPWGYFDIKNVKFGNTTKVIWKDGSKTSIVCPDGLGYTKETGLAMCFSLRQQGITSVFFNDPLTVVIWEDGAKTIVKCQEGDTYSKETGLAMCIAKKALGNKCNFNKVFHKWIPEEG